MTQSSCKRNTKSKSHPSVKLAPVRVFSCKHPLKSAICIQNSLESAPIVMFTWQLKEGIILHQIGLRTLYTCRHSICYNTSDISRGSRWGHKQTNGLEVSDELTHQSPVHSCQRSSISPYTKTIPFGRGNFFRCFHTHRSSRFSASSITPFYHSISLVK